MFPLLLACAAGPCDIDGPPCRCDGPGVPLAATAAPLPADATWLWHLNSTCPTEALARGRDVVIVDLFDTPGCQVEALKQAGHRVLCYVSAGTYEPWRPDKERFRQGGALAGFVGPVNEDWAPERWLLVDPAHVDDVLAIQADRMDLAVEKGCEGLEFDNLDPYDNRVRGVTEAHALAYSLALAEAAHARGLLAGFKNAPDNAAAAEPSFDFVVVESCVRYAECAAYTPFSDAGKPVFSAEYTRRAMGRDGEHVVTARDADSLCRHRQRPEAFRTLVYDDSCVHRDNEVAACW